MKILNIHRKRTPNRGDLASAPYLYFPELADAESMDIMGFYETDDTVRKKWTSKCENADLIILGGGGLLDMPKFAKSVNYICTQDNVVIWGSGHNSVKKQSWSTLGKVPAKNNLKNCTSIGIRDYNKGYEWVPCASCMSDLFDKEYEVEHEFVFFENHTLDKIIRLQESFEESFNAQFIYMNNSKSPLADILAFLGSGETIVTNSYHGAYWGTLLGRKVVGIPSSSKFYNLKYPIPLCSVKDWVVYRNLARSYEESLEESRQANIDFSQKVFERFKIPKVHVYNAHPGKDSSDSRQDTSAIAPETHLPHANEDYDILIYGPLTASGLTTQITQLISIFEKEGISYRITYMTPPEIEHKGKAFWVDIENPGKPKVIFCMERWYRPDHPNFAPALKLYYLNLDWLKPHDFNLAKEYADIVLFPVDFRFDELAPQFKNSIAIKLKWPAISHIKPVSEKPKLRDDSFIKVLYIGNDLDARSRKNPYAVLDAITRTDNKRLKFYLKFRTPLDDHYKHMMDLAENIEFFSDEVMSDREVEELHDRADVTLIPNDSEGNGLSILESTAKGVIPIVLNGKPMSDIVLSDWGYLIDCEENHPKCEGIEYRTTAEDILKVLNEITPESVNSKRKRLVDFQSELTNREKVFHGTILELLALKSVPYHKFHNKNPDRGLLKKYRKPIQVIDVYLTTARRPQMLSKTLPAVLMACETSSYHHNITVLVDNAEDDTMDVISPYRSKINVFSLSGQLGLPLLYNLILQYTNLHAQRVEQRPDYVCYIQDDCLIEYPKAYFSEMVHFHQEVISPDRAGYVSGYYCPLHPGYEKRIHRGNTVILSDSIDGKNFMTPFKLLHSVGPLSWYDKDGKRRGNPQPGQGSGFDLWQWRDSPNNLKKQGRTNLIIPGLCRHLAESADLSTWNNSTTQETIQDRLKEQRFYNTRGGQTPSLSEEEYFVPANIISKIKSPTETSI